MRIALAVVLFAICLTAVVRIGASVYDYQIEMMDLNAPKINVKPTPLPAPHHFHNDFPPVAHPVQPAPPCYSSGDPCKAREVVFI